MGKYDNTSMAEVKRLAKQNDPEAEYELAWRYYTSSDWQNAVNWFKKITLIDNHPNRVKSVSMLASIYAANGSPYSDKNEAVRLYESIKNVPTAIIAKLNLGFLYCEMNRINDGLDLIEGSVKMLIDEDGNDGYLKQIECYKIGVAYEGAQCFELSKAYYKKAIERCDRNYESDRNLIQKATDAIADCDRRKSMRLEDMGKYRKR